MQLNDFHIIKALGEGGFSNVYLGSVKKCDAAGNVLKNQMVALKAVSRKYQNLCAMELEVSVY